MSTDFHALLTITGQAARQAAQQLALASTTAKNKALHAIADAIKSHQTPILTANQKDNTEAKKNNLSAALLDRLTLNPQRIAAMAQGLVAIAELPDPIGTILATIQRPNGLQIDRIRVPIGVIGVIYEARPNVTTDAAGLCLKSGNSVILRGGSECFHSAQAIMSAIAQALKQTDVPATVVQMLDTPDRAAVNAMLKMDKYIDVIIPRGGQQLIEYVSKESRVPVFKHLAGLCHTYIHQAADKEMARKIIMNAKMRRTGICGATEVLLIDKAVAQTHLPDILHDLIQAGCEIRGDEAIMKFDARVKPSNTQDFDTEFLDAILAVKIIDDLPAAIKHITQHGTQHTDAIITEDKNAAERFFREIDSAIVVHNASTQFADGGEFGMGAEIGIATGKLHARGPVGVEQLTIFKYLVRGSGQVRA